MPLFTIVHHHRHYYTNPTPGVATLDDLKALEARLMSALSDSIAATSASADSAIARVTTEVSALKAQVATLQATVDSGGASQADLDALAALKAKLDGLDPSNPAVLPTVAKP